MNCDNIIHVHNSNPPLLSELAFLFDLDIKMHYLKQWQIVQKNSNESLNKSYRKEIICERKMKRDQIKRINELKHQEKCPIALFLGDLMALPIC